MHLHELNFNNVLSFKAEVRQKENIPAKIIGHFKIDKADPNNQHLIETVKDLKLDGHALDFIRLSMRTGQIIVLKNVVITTSKNEKYVDLLDASNSGYIDIKDVMVVDFFSLGIVVESDDKIE